MRPATVGVLILTLAGAVVAFCGELQLEVVWRASIGLLPETGITRASVCSSGMAVVTHNSGELTLVDANGGVVRTYRECRVWASIWAAARN